MKEISYASGVGSLMYPHTCSRPNITFAAGMFGRYQSNLEMDPWKATKKLMRYLKGMKNYMLIFKRSNNLEVIG